MLLSAIEYAVMGWPVLPLYGIKNGACACEDAQCRSPGKHPITELVPHGFHDATTDQEKIRDWFTRVPDANIGVPTGLTHSGFVALDVDPRNGGDTTLAALLREHGALPETAIQVTGGGGLHFLFKASERRLRSPGAGIDVKDVGGYIVVAPSKHISGQEYFWDGEFDPMNGCKLSEPPEWLLGDSISMRATAAVSKQVTGFLSEERIRDIRAALMFLDSSHYETWIKVGMALYSTHSEHAFPLWDEWSKSAKNYDKNLYRRWLTFSRTHSINVETVFYMAAENGFKPSFKNMLVPQNQFSEEIAKPERLEAEAREFEAKNQTPNHLLQVPGVLQEFVNYCNQSAPKPQPQFAVQAALALGSIVLGRRWSTTNQNYASMYFVNVGRSASGKEHARTAIESALMSAKLENLIGPSGYTSDSAVFSALLSQPAHITIIDEMGAMLGNSKAAGNFHKRQSLDILTQAWGQLHGSLRPLGYSTMTLAKRYRDEQEQRIIRNPAITLLGMTTPKTFYQALTEEAIEGGFLNRLLIVESTLGPQVRNRVTPADVPESVVQWCQAGVLASSSGGNLTGVELGPSLPSLARVVDISERAQVLFSEYEAKCIKNIEILEGEGLAEMEGRSVEKAMRIALILAVSANIASPVVSDEHAHWAIQYVDHYTQQTIDSIRKNMVGSEFGRLKQAVLEVIEKGFHKGRTERELSMYSRTYKSLDLRLRRSIIDALLSEQAIVQVNFASARGPSQRLAYVATQYAGDHSEAAADSRRH
ncbi:MAG: DUF3987 domain-containing protein [Desulfurellales bacterium]|nr:MAG: DUF3987 domain-containing protein [Desulfurellales bacterium]